MPKTSCFAIFLRRHIVLPLFSFVLLPSCLFLLAVILLSCFILVCSMHIKWVGQSSKPDWSMMYMHRQTAYSVSRQSCEYLRCKRYCSITETFFNGCTRVKREARPWYVCTHRLLGMLSCTRSELTAAHVKGNLVSWAIGRDNYCECLPSLYVRVGMVEASMGAQSLKSPK